MRYPALLALAGALVLAAAARPAVAQTDPTVEITIGKSIENKVVADTGSAFPADVGSLVCLTKVTGAADTKITHVWTHGPHSSSVELAIGGTPWRTFSRKIVPADWTGEWTLEVKDASGKVLASKKFTVGG